MLIATLLPLAATAQPSPDAPAGPSALAAPEGARVESVELVDRIEADGTMLRRQRNRVRAIDAAGVAALSQVAVPYLEANQKVELTRLTLIKLDGRELDLLPGAPRDVAPVYPPNLPIYSDLRVLRAAVPSIEIGDRLDWETTVAVTPLAPGEAWTEAVFADADQADLQVYELDVAESLPVRVHVRNGFEAVPTEERASGRRVLRWRLEGRPAESPDAAVGGGGASDAAGAEAAEEGWEPHVSVSTFDSWGEFGRWWAALAPPRVDDALRAKAAELVAGAEDRRAKLARLHRYVAQEIRYLTLPLGLGRYRAREPGEVIATGLGDCKDKIRLLASLAAAIGIDVDPVLVGVERRRRVDGAPSPFSFDHVVARVRLGDETIWMDPTSEMTAMGSLPAAVRDLPGVALVGRTETPLVELATTPARPSVESARLVETTATIDPAGRIHGKVRWTFHGDDEPWRIAIHYANAEQRRQLAEAMSSVWGEKREVGELAAGDPTDLETPFWIEYAVERPFKPTLWAKSWDLWLPTPGLDLPRPPDAEEAPEAARRPLRPAVPLRQTTIGRFELPDGVRATPPVPVRATREIATYRSDYRLDGRTLVVERELVLSSPKIEPSKFAELDALVDLMVEDRDQELDFAAAPELIAAAADTADTLAERCDDAADDDLWQEAESLCRRALELDPAHGDAWTDLGRALHGQDRSEEAEAAHRKQVELVPEHGSAWANLAIVARDRGDLEEAEELARKQVEVAPFRDYGYQHLALVLKRAGRLEEAETAFARALKLDSDSDWTRRQLLELRAELGRCAEVLAELAADPEVIDDFDDRARVAWFLLDDDCRPLAPIAGWFEKLGRDATSRLESVEAGQLRPAAHEAAGALATTWHAAGAIALERGEVAEADRFLEAALALSPSPQAALRRAEALDALGRRADAELHFAIAAVLNGRHAEEDRERFEAEVPDPRDRSNLRAFSGEAAWKLRSTTLELPDVGAAQGKLHVVFGPDGLLLSAAARSDDAPGELVRAVSAARPAIPVPPGNRARVPRRADVHCTATGTCTLLYDWPYDAARELSGD
jgi:tetratricopeptide (TPR) repeat protein/transglutaminase-like putative cysteine protease